MRKLANWMCVIACLMPFETNAIPVPDPLAKKRESRYVSNRMNKNEKRAYRFEKKFRLYIEELALKAKKYGIRMPTVDRLTGLEKMDLSKYRSGGMSSRSMDAYEAVWKGKYASVSQAVDMAEKAEMDVWRAANPAAAARADAAVNASVRSFGGDSPSDHTIYAFDPAELRAENAERKAREAERQVERNRQRIERSREELRSRGVEVPHDLLFE